MTSSNSVSNPTTPTSTSLASSGSPSNLRNLVSIHESSVSLGGGGQKANGLSQADVISYRDESAAVANYGNYTANNGADATGAYQSGYHQQQATNQTDDITQLTVTSSPAVVPLSSSSSSTSTSSSSSSGNAAGSSSSFVTTTATTTDNKNTNSAGSNEPAEDSTVQGYNQFQLRVNTSSEQTSLDAHLATGVAHAQHQPHQFTPTFANHLHHHHHQHQQQQHQDSHQQHQIGVDHLTLNYHPSEQSALPSTDFLALQQQQHPHQYLHQQNQPPQQRQPHHYQYNGLSSAMQQNHHQLMMEQHYSMSAATAFDPHIRSTGSPSAQNLMNSIGKH